MKYAGHLIKTKGLFGLFTRSRQIFQRFGITSKKIEQQLETFIDITDEFDCKPTLCITAILLDSYPELVDRLNHRKAELALHGFVHTDYTTLSQEKIDNHLFKATKIFKGHETPLFGFRFPYLSWNERALSAFGASNFLWSSNQVICWNILEKQNILKRRWNNFQRVINSLYVARNASEYLSLPRIQNGFVEIPVSVPDDEIIIDRLGICNGEEIARICLKILDETYKRGELYTFQSHHERVPYYHTAVRSVLKKARALDPAVWVATLKEIAEWWKEKQEFSFQTIAHKNNCFHIKANCSDRATVLVKKSDSGNSSTSLFDHYDIINDREFNMECDKKPFIGIAENSPRELVNFLHEEGFMTEIGSHKDDYSLYLGNCHTLNTGHEKDLIGIIERAPFPLIRFWRWPNKAQSALAITGDIDGITILDFLKRYFLF